MARMQVSLKCYQILDLKLFAGKPEIRKAYKRMALKYHPDRGGDPEKMKWINHAYEILSKYKNQYDALLRQRMHPEPSLNTQNTFRWSYSFYAQAGDAYSWGTGTTAA